MKDKSKPQSTHPSFIRVRTCVYVCVRVLKGRLSLSIAQTHIIFLLSKRNPCTRREKTRRFCLSFFSGTYVYIFFFIKETLLFAGIYMFFLGYLYILSRVYIFLLRSFENKDSKFLFTLSNTACVYFGCIVHFLSLQ